MPSSAVLYSIEASPSQFAKRRSVGIVRDRLPVFVAVTAVAVGCLVDAVAVGVAASSAVGDSTV